MGSVEGESTLSRALTPTSCGKVNSEQQVGSRLESCIAESRPHPYSSIFLATERGILFVSESGHCVIWGPQCKLGAQ